LLCKIDISQVRTFVMYRAMNGSKQKLINDKDDELDDEFETATIILIGSYRRGMRRKHRGHNGSVVGHEDHYWSRQKI
jgi:hypothetical protein